jgi:hypothetical protein
MSRYRKTKRKQSLKRDPVFSAWLKKLTASWLGEKQAFNTFKAVGRPRVVKDVSIEDLYELRNVRLKRKGTSK